MNFEIQPAGNNACANVGNARANINNFPEHNPRSMCKRWNCISQHRFWPYVKQSKFKIWILGFSLLAKMHVPILGISLSSIKDACAIVSNA